MNERKYRTKINAPEIEGRTRHLYIFEEFDRLNAGEFIELSNDHDPKPLFHLFMVEREGIFTWEYLQEGPLLWQVAIGKK
ncbi:DUF2249 domain-containing protein [Virgibacillus alimentarius]|uniref:DUF2249 domain-containing protein n=1 Tax=Virgibacillus alimentarius TaxID=698769 RepID=UPI000493685A|nr:DUF2249 domain-containing protein [Virgibacillus alimentarius]